MYDMRVRPANLRKSMPTPRGYERECVDLAWLRGRPVLMADCMLMVGCLCCLCGLRLMRYYV